MPVLNFTPDQTAKLEHYVALLRKWQAAINLVSKTTLDDAWNRHVRDSAQLAAFIPKTAYYLTDIGSGAGFPGLVLAILRPDLNVTLIESDQRKCTFMQTVSRETATPVTILTQRIEAVNPVPKTDILTARALASLAELLDYAAPFYAENPNLTCLFLKGRTAADEISAAGTAHHFSHERFDSVTDPEACILKIRVS